MTIEQLKNLTNRDIIQDENNSVYVVEKNSGSMITFVELTTGINRKYSHKHLTEYKHIGKLSSELAFGYSF
ncbi:hypothetical protein [Mammaliicoccus sp. P-M59]|uniref:hypothetical protein n=1 Tax=Mammaliicoccus sp. P-M59 TaxID=2898718 RepID=UPI001EFB56F9|nr:hypothetical protein [Mammaliicoccus sp. P-M59]